MARNHARVAVSIWQDEDFLRLDPGPQRLYLFLLSQPNLSHLGVLPLTIRRWSKSSAGYNAGCLSTDLEGLVDAGFVVVDESAEELLIRSLVRNDGVYKQPNVMRSAIASAPAVQSVTIKRALLAEVDRIDVTDLSDEVRARSTVSPRGEALSLLTALREAIAVPPPKGSPKGSAGGSPNPSGGVPATPLEGFPIPPTHARAQPLVLSPSPTPSPTPTSGEGRASRSIDAAFGEWWEVYPRKQSKKAARAAYARSIRSAPAAVMLEAARRYADDPTRDAHFTALPATWLNHGRWEDEGPVSPPSNVTPMRTGRIAEADAILAEAFHRGEQQPELGA